MLLNKNGGIIDDTIITKHSADAFYVVTNAGRRDQDLPWFKARLEEWNASERAKDGPVEMQVLEDWGLLALQGTCDVKNKFRLTYALQVRKLRHIYKDLHHSTFVNSLLENLPLCLSKVSICTLRVVDTQAKMVLKQVVTR